MKNKVGALIVAGGISSRMNDFKPLMKIGRYSMIEHIIMNFKSIGIHEVVIVIGYRSYDIEDALRNYDVTFVYNKDYLITKMFDSVCLGLKELSNKVDMIFITPSDCPFIQAFTLKRMIEEMQKNGFYYIKPSYLGENGHPILISSILSNIILNHDGSKGLKGAIAKVTENYKEIKFADPGIVMDADNEIDLINLVKYNEIRKLPSIDLCNIIQEYFQVSKEIKEHSEKVKDVALNIYEELEKKGVILNRDLIVSACLLHDIAKGKKYHDRVGAEWMMEMGFFEVSQIIAEHMNLEEFSEKITEKDVVYLADKLVYNNSISTLEQMFSYKEELYKDNEEVLNIIKRRKEHAMNLYLSIYEDIENL